MLNASDPSLQFHQARIAFQRVDAGQLFDQLLNAVRPVGSAWWEDRRHDNQILFWICGDSFVLGVHPPQAQRGRVSYHSQAWKDCLGEDCDMLTRSEERRVGKEGVSKCRSRG